MNYKKNLFSKFILAIGCLSTMACAKGTTKDVATDDLFLKLELQSNLNSEQCSATVHQGDPSSSALELDENDVLLCKGVKMTKNANSTGNVYFAPTVADPGEEIAIRFERAEGEAHEAKAILPDKLELTSQLAATVIKGSPLNVSWKTSDAEKVVVTARLEIMHEGILKPTEVEDPAPEIGTLSFINGETNPTPRHDGDLEARLELRRELTGAMPAGLKGALSGVQFSSQEFKLVDH